MAFGFWKPEDLDMPPQPGHTEGRCARSDGSARSACFARSARSARSVRSVRSARSARSAQPAWSAQSVRSAMFVRSVRFAWSAGSARSVRSVRSFSSPDPRGPPGPLGPPSPPNPPGPPSTRTRNQIGGESCLKPPPNRLKIVSKTIAKLAILEAPGGLGGSQESPGGVTGRPRQSWAGSRLSWRVLGGALGASWGRLGPVLGCLGAVLGVLRGILGGPGAWILGAPEGYQSALGPFRTDLRKSLLS